MPDLEKQRLSMRRAYAEGIARADGSVDAEQELQVRRHHQEHASDRTLPEQFIPHSCKYCQVFVLDSSGNKIEVGEFFTGPKRLCFHNISLVHAAVGARNGCVLCQSIVNRLDRGDSSIQENSDGDLICHTEIWAGPGGDFDAELVDDFFVMDPTRPWTGGASGRLGNKSHYTCVAEESDPAGSFVTTRPMVIDPGSDESIKLIRSWRAECVYGHESCQHFEALYCPARLVEISEQGHEIALRLVEARSQDPVEYTTLSYCWGGPQHARTTADNIEERNSSFQLADLPTTLQDAIIITHRLGISHIWIDSLCIIQDSTTDKALQIASMPKIYQNASFTISTTRATHADEGFLHPRKTTDTPSTAVALPFRLPSTGELGRVTLLHHAADILDDNLSGRAWTLQEYVLSPRVLDFSGGQTRWTCRGGVRTDGWRRAAGRREEAMRSKFLDMILNNSVNERVFALTKSEGCRLWEGLVTRYTQRLLSVEADRPLAIAGLAEVCCGNVGWKEQYQAGLWRSMFPWALMWSMADRSKRLPRPSTYQGPSWSWTGINGAVHYGLGEKLFGGQIPLTTIDCSTELEYEEAPFGAVKSGALVVEGKILRAKWLRAGVMFSEGNIDAQHDNISLCDPQDGSDGIITVKIRPDAQETKWDNSATEDMEVVLLEVGYEPAEHWNYHGAIGFVLRELADGFYSRLGIFETSRGPALREDGRCEDEAEQLWKKFRDIFNDSEREVLVIV